jgi:hypothetical protein
VAGSYYASHAEIQALYMYQTRTVINIGISTEYGVVCEKSCQTFLAFFVKNKPTGPQPMGRKVNLWIQADKGPFAY